MTRAEQATHPPTADTAELTAWLIRQGLDGTGQEALLQGYCQQLIARGVPLFRLHVAQRAFHPEFGGMGFDWWRDTGLSRESYAHENSVADSWRNSPLYHLLVSGQTEMRETLAHMDAHGRFPILQELREKGATDYFAMAMAFEKLPPGRPIDPQNTPEGIVISWTSDHGDGFSATHIRLIRDVMPALGLALKSASNRRMAQDLLAVYLGADAGARVLSGEIRRGSLQRIDAAICYFDLSGFTRLAERTEVELLIGMLNDYFGLAVDHVQSRGGTVLKFIGDGLLAMFDGPDKQAASVAALDMVAALRRRIAARNLERAGEGLPTADVTLALHAGEIFYGNIGGKDRLDFTVIGPTVNLAARLSGMHAALGQSVILSEAIVRYAGETRHDLVPLGRVMLRGVAAPQALFTLHDPGLV